VPTTDVPTDPWTAFLNWLETIIIPDWNGLIRLLPILLVVGVIGPILTLLAAYWLYSALTSRRAHVSVAELEPTPAPVDEMGSPIYPPNVPYCATHAMLYPPTERNCAIDREELLVRCPVDDAVRNASQQLCRACGTRYQLGASLAPVVVKSNRQPPRGGAAIA
jgi:hypothetical protein